MFVVKVDDFVEVALEMFFCEGFFEFVWVFNEFFYINHFVGIFSRLYGVIVYRGWRLGNRSRLRLRDFDFVSRVRLTKSKSRRRLLQLLTASCQTPFCA